jgi:Flavodoxin domain
MVAASDMKALVVYESMYGNTRAVAEAIAEGLVGSAVRAVHEAGQVPEQLDLLVVGGPTHMHGLTTALSRRLAAEAANEDGHASLEPAATAQFGLRGWLRDLVTGEGVRAAAFDTRLDRSPALTGAAARGIARRLRQRDYEVLAAESFFVQDAEGPLEDGELERARAWGEQLAQLVDG